MGEEESSQFISRREEQRKEILQTGKTEKACDTPLSPEARGVLGTGRRQAL